MSHHYSDPSRADDPYSLPDVEVWQARYGYCPSCGELVHEYPGAHDGPCYACDTRVDTPTLGWFYHSCFPGCLPDSEPNGPFATEQEALADAREGMDSDDDNSATEDNS